MSEGPAFWRSHPFKPGITYVAKDTFPGFPTHEFIAGRRYGFDRAAYSRYDSGAQSVRF